MYLNKQIPSTKLYGPNLNSGTVTPHRNISWWNISTRSSLDYGMMNGNAIHAEEEEDVNLEQDPQAVKYGSQIVEELLDESEEVNSPCANIPKH